MAIRFVEVMNKCKDTVKVYLRFPRPKKPQEHNETRFELAPGHTSKPVPYAQLVGAKGWNNLNQMPCISFKTVPWTPTFAVVLNNQVSDLTLRIRLKRKKLSRTKVIKIKPGASSPPIHLPSLLERTKLKSLERKKRVSVKPLAYIGPRIGTPPAAGSYGYEDIYICYDCGGPIVFRGTPPHPVHV